jgi:hypothetical protein
MRKSITLLLLMLGLGMGASAVKGQLMITEIMYRSPAVNGALDSLEYIEIYNNTTDQINLTGYTLTGVTFGFPNYTIDPGDFVIVCREPAGIIDYFGILPNFYGWSAGNLSNLGEAIVLKNAQGVTVDSVFYGNVAPWPTQGNGDGYALTFCDRSLDNSNGANWSASSTAVPGGISQGMQLFSDLNACCTTLDIIPPTIVSATLTNYQRIGIQFSEPLSLPSRWIGNFGANVSSIASVTPGMTPDSLIVMLASPLADGEYDMIFVSNIADDACNTLIADSFQVVNNYGTPPLRIGEIMYDDPSVGDSLEFIEIFNQSPTPVPLGGLRIAGDIQVTLPEITIPGLGRVAVARYPQLANQIYSPVTPMVGWDSGTLGDQFGSLEVWNTAALLDSFTYMTTGFWPNGANATGRSIMMCDETLSQGSPSSWSESLSGDFTTVYAGDSIFATPTRQNCRPIGTENPVAMDYVDLYPNPFEHQLNLGYTSDEELKVSIFDAQGRLVKSFETTERVTAIDLSASVSGVYFVRLSSTIGDYLGTIKVIKL